MLVFEERDLEAVHLPRSGKRESCSLVGWGTKRRRRRLLYWLRATATGGSGGGSLWSRSRCDRNSRGTRRIGARNGDGGVNRGGSGSPSLGLFGCRRFGETEGFLDVVRLERLPLGSDERLLIDRLPKGGIVIGSILVDHKLAEAE